VPEPDNPYVWKPQNVKEVRAYGIESRVELGKTIGHFSLDIQAAYSLSKSINESTESTGYGQQLPYVPVHKGIITAKAAFSHAFIEYTQSFTGNRSPVEDNSETLPAYSLGRLIAGYQLIIRRYDLDFFFRLENIWDISYEVVQYYPNPGRSFTLGLRLACK
jgi:iron complex outermembrane receptor protein